MPLKSSSSSSSPSNAASLWVFTSNDGDSGRKRSFTTGSTTTTYSEPLSTSPTQILRFAISDFAGLVHPKGSFVETRSIKILDRSWRLRIYPRGHGRSRSDKVLVSCFLTVGNDCDDRPNETRVSLSPSSSSSSSSSLFSPQTTKQSLRSSQVEDKDGFEFSFRIQNWRMVPKRCCFRSDVAYGIMGHTRENILEKGLDEDGTLVVGVALKFFRTSPPKNESTWYPNKKKQRRNTDGGVGCLLGRQLFWSHEFADLAFRVGKAVFRAHKCVLAIRSRTLLELALLERGNDVWHNKSSGGTNENENENENDTIEVPGVEEDVFRAFLDYVYTSNEERLLRFLGKDDPCGTARSLLVVADRFGATDLKIFVESVLADKFLTISNCCEMILLADSHWCALLKEESMNLYCSDPNPAIEGSAAGWKLLQESPKLLSELLLVSASKTGRRRETDERRKPSNSRRFLEDCSVAALRNGLEEAGLGIDGSKEMLIQRTEDSFLKQQPSF